MSLWGDFGLIGALYDVSGRSGVTTKAYVADMRRSAAVTAPKRRLRASAS